jgi:hypothetical protein
MIVITGGLVLKAKVLGQFDVQFWVERKSMKPISFLINGRFTPSKHAEFNDVKLVICRLAFRKTDANASNRRVRYLTSYELLCLHCMRNF